MSVEFGKMGGHSAFSFQPRQVGPEGSGFRKAQDFRFAPTSIEPSFRSLRQETVNILNTNAKGGVKGKVIGKVELLGRTIQLTQPGQ